MDRFFKNVQRINSLLPLLALIVVSCLLAWDSFKVKEIPAASVVAPNDSGDSKMFYFLHLDERLEQNGISILRLVASDNKGWNYEDRHSHTRNLLLIPESRQPSHWLFKDQTQRINLVEKIPNKEGVLAKALYIEAEPIIKKSSLHTDEDKVTISLAKLNGEKPVAILSKIDKVIGHHVIGNALHIIYQQGVSVRSAEISIADFKMQSDHEVAKMMGLPSQP